MIGIVLSKEKELLPDSIVPSYDRYLIGLQQSLQEVEYIRPFDNGEWDILILQHTRFYIEKNADIANWVREINPKATWYVSGDEPCFHYFTFDRGLFWYPTPGFGCLERSKIRKLSYWLPPIPIIPKQQLNGSVLLYYVDRARPVMTHLLTLVSRIQETFGLILEVVGLANKQGIPYHYISDNKLSHTNFYSYSSELSSLARTNAVISTREIPCLAPLECWAQGTPCITYEHQACYLEPDYGITVPRYETASKELELETSRLFTEEVFQALVKVLQPVSNVDRTIKYIQRVTNPQRQAEQLKQLVEQDVY